MALTPDGKTLAEAIGTEVVLWELATGREMRRFTGSSNGVSSVAFSPAGKTLAVGCALWQQRPGWRLGSTTATIHLWDVATGKARQLNTSAHNGRIECLGFSPDGTLLVSGSSDFDVCLWDVAGQRERARLDVTCRCLAFAPDGKLLALANSGWGKRELLCESAIQILDPTTGKQLRALRGHLDRVNSLAFAPDGKTLASAGEGGTIRLWDAATGRSLIRQEGHQAAIRSVAFSPDGALVGTVGSADHTIRVWGSASGVQRTRIDLDCNSRSAFFCTSGHGQPFAFGPEGKTVVCDGTFYDPATGAVLRTSPAETPSADGKLLAGWLNDPDHPRSDYAVRVRATGRQLLRFSVAAGKLVRAIAFSPDGQRLAVSLFCFHKPNPEMPAEASVYLYDLTSGKLLHKFRPGDEGPYFLRFSPDGELLATSASKDKPVQLWRVATGQECCKLEGQEVIGPFLESQPVAFSPNGRLLAAAGKDMGIALWEVATGQRVHRLIGHQVVIRGLAFSPDGRRLLSGSADTTALLWDLAPQGKKANLSPEGLQALWDLLASSNAKAAYHAAWTLAAGQDKALGLLRERLKPLPEPALKRVPALLADLDSDQFAVRVSARRELKTFGPLVEQALRQALAGKLSVEVRKSLELLLAELYDQPIPAEELRQLRAIQASGVDEHTEGWRIARNSGARVAVAASDPGGGGIPAPAEDPEAGTVAGEPPTLGDSLVASRGRPSYPTPRRSLSACNSAVRVDFMSEITHLLNALDQGDQQAARQLLPFVYDELRRLAAQKLAQEKAGQTLQPTALVHEAYLRLVGDADEARWDNRGHFFAAAAEAMRRILVENARRKKRARHGGNRQRVELDEQDLAVEGKSVDLLALDEALTALAGEDPQAAEIVKLHFFAGLSLEQAGRTLGISRATAYRQWSYARAWLRCAMNDGEGPSAG